MIVFYRFLCLSLGLFLSTAAVAETYVFATGDSVLIRAGRWDHTAQRFEYWDGVSGEYRVSTSGDIQVPLAGTVVALGKTADSLSALISLQIQRRIGLTKPPEVAVEIVGHTPIYMSGAVTTPGSYTYRLGMTVQQALAQAGGLGASGTANQGTDQELIRHSGQITILSQKVAELQSEEIRLEAEVAAIEARADGETLPAEQASLVEGIQQELFDARQRSIGTREENIRELQSLVAEQLERLDQQIELVQQQVAIAREDAATVEDLRERGLAVRARESSALLALANLESQQVRLEVARLEAVQQLNLARRDEITLFDEARLGRLTMLRDVRLDLAAARAEMQTSRALYAEAALRGGSMSLSTVDSEVTFVVTRETEGAFERIAADLDTRLRPGDTIDVSVELAAPNPSN